MSAIDKILTAIRNSGRLGRTAEGISEATGIQRSTIASTVFKLKGRGDIVNVATRGKKSTYICKEYVGVLPNSDPEIPPPSPPPQSFEVPEDWKPPAWAVELVAPSTREGATDFMAHPSLSNGVRHPYRPPMLIGKRGMEVYAASRLK